MATYSPSKITKDGNTYNFTDTTKIPLAGTNALAGSIVPDTDNSVDLGSSSKNIKMLYIKGITLNGTQFLPSDYIPRSGGAVMTGTNYARDVNNSYLSFYGGSEWLKGGMIFLTGEDNSVERGVVEFIPANTTDSRRMYLWPDGTWTWTGTACQITSDQRYKQQIAEIDDKLLDAWEDVELCQFKYNDAVDTKGKDKARLHTGYVVQQIDSACKSHNVDISEYGLYCHEEYPEETEEVEVLQKDGTKTKEKKVIREASEHYSLRYTEALIVECAYLRKCIKELRNEIEELKGSK